jgi:hypothetical protein
MPASATTTKSGVGSLTLCPALTYVEMQIARISPDKVTAKRLLLDANINTPRNGND